VNASPTSSRTWQWLRGSSAISGATSATYTAVTADIGATLSASQLETNFLGTATATSAASETVQAFDPIRLFSASEPGVWYDPNDITTLFKEPAGINPVTAPGDNVGLMLDKSKGLVLGPDTAVNGSFATDTGWTKDPGWTIASGKASASGTAGYLYQNGSAAKVVGLVYKITFTVSDYVSGNVTPYISNVTPTGTPFNSNGDKTVYLRAINTSAEQGFAPPGAGSSFSIDNYVVRELAGNHATQSITASQPIYGIVPAGGRRNILLWSEAINTAAVWTTRSTTATASVLTATAGAGDHDVLQVVAAVTGSMTFSVKLKAGTSNFAWVCLSPTFGLSNYATAVVNLATGAVTKTQASGTVTITGSSVSPVDVDGFYRVSFSVSSGGTGINAIVGITTSATPTIGGYGQVDLTAVGTETIQVKEAQLEQSATATPYQRVTTTYDVTEAGVASLGYLFFDGSGDFMVTPTITPGTDKAQVFAGVRKLSDAATGIIAELSVSANSNNGVFVAYAPSSPGAGDYFLGSKGTAGIGITGAASSTSVYTGLLDIAAPLATLRLNGVQSATTSSTQGTGNFLAYPLYIGRRGGTTLPFSGHIHSLIVRFGPNLTTARISATESWVASKTAGVTL
jgi:hypothetical protein